MAKQVINTGVSIGDRTGDIAPVAYGKVNAMMTELYGNQNTLQQTPWGPTLTANSGSYAPTFNSGNYVQVGSLVLVTFQCLFASIGTLSGGSLRVNGLPVLPNQDNQTIWYFNCYVLGAAFVGSSNVPIAYMNSPSPVVYLKTQGTSAGLQNLSPSLFAGSGSIQFTGVYNI